MLQASAAVTAWLRYAAIFPISLPITKLEQPEGLVEGSSNYIVESNDSSVLACTMPSSVFTIALLFSQKRSV